MFRYLVLISALIGSFVHAETVAKTRQQVLEHFQRANYSGVVGLYTGAERWEQSIGLSSNQPGQKQDRFLIGSTSKQFVAAAILKLMDQGKLEMKDPVVKWIPNFRFPDITIHHLLSHTSGLFEIVATPEFSNLKRQKFENWNQLLDLLISLPVEFPAGSRWQYSNSNYLLLSKIVENVSGETWWSYVKRELVDVAGMRNTDFQTTRSAQVVDGHDFGPDYELIAIPEQSYFEQGWAQGAGGIQSTASDLSLWNKALFEGRLLSPQALSLMTQKHAMVDNQNAYGYGLFIGKDAKTGETYYFHSGSIPGFISYNTYYPDRHLSAITVANFSGAEPIELVKSLVRVEFDGSVVLKDILDNPAAMIGNLDEFIGQYACEGVPEQIQILQKAGHLYLSLGGMPEHRLVIRKQNRFYDRALMIELVFDESNPGEFDIIVDQTTLRFRKN